MSTTCTHVDQVREVTPSADGCEDWWWCYADEVAFMVESAAPAPSHGGGRA